MTSTDKIELHELINLHGHLMDEGAFDRLDELFTSDVVYDLSALGGGELHGTEAIAAAGRQFGDRNPLGHHVTNVVVVRLEGDVAEVHSKALAVMSDSTAGSMVYQDQVKRTDAGWRIARRVILPRKRPLQASGPAADRP